MPVDPIVVSGSLEIAKAVIEGVVATCAPIIAWKLASLAGQGNNTTARGVIADALDRGTGLALDHGIAAADPLLTNVANRDAAVNIALQYVVAHAADEAKLLNVSETALGVKVQATLANKLHPSIVAVLPPTTNAAPIVTSAVATSGTVEPLADTPSTTTAIGYIHNA